MLKIMLMVLTYIYLYQYFIYYFNNCFTCLYKTYESEEYGITIAFVLFGKLVAGFFHFSLHDASYRYYFDYKNQIKILRH